MIRAQTVLRTFVLLVILFLELAKTDYTLGMVQVVFRHGERSPREVEMVPIDPNPAAMIKQFGFGQLTNQGKMREFRIGKMLRERYGKFLGPIYQPKDVYAASTQVDRTKMSLLLVLAGLYPPPPVQLWNNQLPWLPPSTHFFPRAFDNVLRPHSCPAYKEELLKVRTSEEVRKKASVYQDFFKFLSEKTGAKIASTQDAVQVFHLLTAEKAMNLKIPQWYTGNVVKRLHEVVTLYYQVRSYTRKLKRLSGGMLIKKFLDNMNLNGHRNNPAKIYLYSGHEVNVAAVSGAHSFIEPKIPAYGSAILMEKLLDKYGNVFVRLLLWTGVTEELAAYNIPHCGEICPIGKYIQYVKNVLPSQKEADCLVDSATKDDLRRLLE